MIKRIEAGLIDSIAAVTPWLAPLIPAYLVYHNMLERLGYSQLFALIGAGAVEFLGLSAVHTAVTFWQWNDTRKVGRAPLLAALGAGGFYVIIVLVVNAVLDIAQGTPSEQGVKILAHGLLSLLSVDAAVIIAIRASHARRVTDDATERQRRADERKAARIAEVTAKQTQPANAIPQTQIKRKPVAQGAKAQFIADMQGRNGEGPLTTSQIMEQYNVSERTAQYWLSAYREQHDDLVMESAN